MANIVVDSSVSLISAVKLAKDGDVILLKAGDYKSVNFSNIHVNGNVTITSADAGAPARLLDLAIKSSSGLSFDNVHFAPQSVDRAFTFLVANSSDVHFSSVQVNGPEGAMGYKSSPFMIRNSQNVSVTNSEFAHLQHGISVLDSKGISLTENYFHDIRTDGIRGGGVSDLTISGNYMTDFRPAVGDHPDGIQLWTTNTKASATNIVITDNIITRGTGDPIQGIFMRDQVGTLPYQNVTISGNMVVGGMYNGIAVGHLENLSVTNNIVAALPGQKSWIGVNSASDSVVSNNIATTYNFGVSNVELVTSQNTTIATPIDGGAALLDIWLRAHQGMLADQGSLLTSVLNLSGTPPIASPPVVSDPVTPPIATPEKVEPPVAPVAPAITDITGTSGADTLKVSGSGESNIYAGEGNDTLHGGSGKNQLVGGNGNDIYHVKGTGDTVVEGKDGGRDTVYAYVNHMLAANVETLRMAKEGLVGEGNALGNRMIGSAGVDTLYGHAGDDNIQGEGGNDILYGGAGQDTLLGGDGDDRLYGGDGNDILSGNAGNDMIDGGAGNDSIEGGAGDNLLTGGAGSDVFIFRSIDPLSNNIITDFNAAEKDKIGLSLIDANAKTAANDAFKFIGAAEFTKTAGQLRYEVADGHSYVSGDINGDGVADFTLVLQNVDMVRASDFIL